MKVDISWSDVVLNPENDKDNKILNELFSSISEDLKEETIIRDGKKLIILINS